MKLVNMGRAALCAAIVASCGSVQAGTAGSQLTVIAKVNSACTISNGVMNFGQFSALASTGTVNADSGSSVQLACSKGLNPKFYAAPVRTMVSAVGSHTLNYSLYMDAGRTFQVPGNGGATAADLVYWMGAPTDGQARALTLYGTIASSDVTSAVAGDYSQVLQLSVEY